jgi:hypothetical protein
VFLVLLSCTKEPTVSKLGLLDLSGGYALVVQEYPDNSGLTANQTPDFAKLYKITNSDTLQTVTYRTADGADMGYAYIPEAVYDLNSSYLFLTLTRKDQIPKNYESYLIQKATGIATEITPEFHPGTRITNQPSDDYSPKAFREGAPGFFYCFTDHALKGINLNGTNEIGILSQTISDVVNSDFSADTDGNFLIDGKYITANGSLDVPVYKTGKSFVSKALDKGIYMVTLIDSFAEIDHIYLENNSLKTDLITTLSKGTETWTFRGSASFPDDHCSVIVFDKGIISITPLETKLLPLSMFSLSSIDLMDHSVKKFYIAGTNVLNKRVFMLMNPSTNPITFTQTFSPGIFDYKILHASPENVVTFFATRSADNREVFGYVPESSNVMIKVNNQGIKVKQVVAFK